LAKISGMQRAAGHTRGAFSFWLVYSIRMRHVHPFYYVVGGLFLIVFGSIGYLAWYGHNQILDLNYKIAGLHQALDSTTDLLKVSIASSSATLAAELNAQLDNQKQILNSQIGSVEQTLGSVSGTVTTLQKLSQTDKQLLAKYSKVYFLNEHYNPERLTPVPQQYTYSTTRVEQVLSPVWPHMQSMLEAAKSSGVMIYVKSAYRSYDEQQALKGVYTVTYGAGTANTFSADQGYSEHQLGTTADFISTGQGGVLDGFDKTTAYSWMVSNAYRYGFILSYPKGNGYYIYEPWHWRYVGVKLATDLHNQGKNFYDLDQRTIDAYLINIFD
jgi:LAS superfamily LD-carboxypeptidase LdcB